MKKINRLLALLLFCCVPAAHAQINTFPAAEGFESGFTTGINVQFIPSWTGNEVTASSRIFRDNVNFRTGSGALAIIPTSGFSGDVRVALDLTGQSNMYMNFWARTVKNGTAADNRPAIIHASVSLDNGLTFSTPTLVGDSTVFANNNTPYAQYTYNLPGAASNQPNVIVRYQVTRGSGSGTTARLVIDDAEIAQNLSDMVPPSALTIVAQDLTHVAVVFNEAVSSTAEIAGNYTGIPAISSITRSVTNDTALITLASPLQMGTFYTVTVASVQDLAGNSMTLPYSKQIVFNNTLPDLIFSEIMYDPAGDDSTEFIEIYYRGIGPAPVGGLKIADGIDAVFPDLTLNGGQTILFAANVNACSNFYGQPFYPFTGAISNGGETFRILNTQNQLIDTITYDDVTPWPVGPPDPNGGGPSIEIVNVNASDDVPSNWQVASNNVGTIGGIAFFASPGTITAPSLNSTVTMTDATYIVDEGDTVSVGITLSNHNSSPSVVKVHLIPGTASPTADFATVPAFVSFTGNADTTILLSIVLTDDAVSEKTEYFSLQLEDSLNAMPGGTVISTIYIKDDEYVAPSGSGTLQLQLLTSFQTGTPGTNSSEISAFDTSSNRLYVANSIANRLDIFDLSNPAVFLPVASIDVSPYGGINSVAAWNGVIAAAIENNAPQQNGSIVFFDASGNYQTQVVAGPMPDMITFSPDHTRILTANEGEPDTDFTNDPEGSVSIVDISGGIAGLTQANVTTATFTSYNGQQATLTAAGIRIFGPFTTVAQNLEPEYITIDANSQTAWITLQENNAIARLDIGTATITDIFALGTKDHSLPRNAFDISNTSGDVLIANWPVKGFYMPDAIASYTIAGITYLVTANEGDLREYDAFEEEVRIGAAGYVLDTAVYGDNVGVLKHSDNAGRLISNTFDGDTDGNGRIEQLYAYGSRSFSIWNGNTGTQIFDSGDDFEQITNADAFYGAVFNASNDNVTKKNRSDDKGPEPEGITTGTINDTVYAFITLERTGGIMVYNVTDPAAPVFVQYINNRGTTAATGDLAPEGVVFVSAAESPIDTALLIVSNEVSSTVSIYKINHYIMPAPVAGFSAADTSVCAGTSVQFTEASINHVTSWSWSFAGGSPATSTQQDPLVIYALPGNYDVTLIVSGLGGTDTLAMLQAITVTALPAPATITQLNATTLQSSSAFGNQWNAPNGTPISGENGMNFQPPANGTYTVTFTDANGCESTSLPFAFINTTGIGNENALPFTAYPNPASDKLSFSRAASVRVYDIAGKQLMAVTDATAMDIAHLSPGTYILVTSEGNSMRFVKQ